MLKLERLRNHKFTKWPNRNPITNDADLNSLLACGSVVAGLNFGKKTV